MLCVRINILMFLIFVDYVRDISLTFHRVSISLVNIAGGEEREKSTTFFLSFLYTYTVV